LIELILVMALLATILAVSVPSLSRFFRSRNLESEALRFLAVTRAAQSRAVAEGVPMVVWFDTKQRTYGLNADKSYVENDTKAGEFMVDDKLEMDLRYSPDAMAVSRTTVFQNEKQATGGLYMLHFNPDGFVSLSSPEAVIFRQGKDDELWVAQSRNRLNYEIQAGKSTYARR
jgi:Tfp pilus assembly protein FimT